MNFQKIEHFNQDFLPLKSCSNFLLEILLLEVIG